MRKFLVIALMVTLIPFAFGCRIIGDYDDGGVGPVVTPPAATTFPLSVKLPATVSNASIRAAMETSGATLVVVYPTSTDTPATLTESTTTTGLYTGTVDGSKLASKDASTYSVVLRLTMADGTEFDLTIEVGKDLNETTPDVGVVFDTLTISSDGTLTVTYTVSYLNTAGTTAGTTGGASSEKVLAIYKTEYAGYYADTTPPLLVALRLNSSAPWLPIRLPPV